MKRLFIVIIFCFSAAFSVSAANLFYVSTKGNDNNAGIQTAPFATIQKAVDVAQAGDSVKVLAGIYIPQNSVPNRGMVIFRHSGTVQNPITFEAVGDVRVKGDGGVWSFGGVFEINAEQSGTPTIHDIVIRGFRLENSSWFGIRINRGENILLENNYTFNTGGSGIQSSDSKKITVRGNTIERACISPDTTIDTQEIISLSNVDGFEVDHNHIFNGGITVGGNGGEGIDAKTGSRNGTIHHNTVHDLVRLGIYIDSWDRIVENINVYSNTVYNCSSGIAISSENGGTVRQVKIFNNVIYNNQYGGIVISAWVSNGPRENIEITNNTIFHNGFRPKGQIEWGGGIIIETAKVQRLSICNNIVSQNKTWQILVNNKTIKPEINQNLIDGFRNYSDNNYKEQRGKLFIEGNPQFINSNEANFRLKPNSPAINSGKCLPAPTIDFDSNTRLQTEGVDIGAFEFK